MRCTLDKLDNICCPEDGVTMVRKTDEQQSHIWYESCTVCGGLYFDAGEFTDLKYDTLMDRVRDFVKGPRIRG